MFFALPVVRRPAPGLVTAFGGGYPASGGLRVGDPVWFRHAKAGELLERFDQVQLVEQAADGTVSRQPVPSYRGEGKNFG